MIRVNDNSQLVIDRFYSTDLKNSFVVEIKVQTIRVKRFESYSKNNKTYY